MFIHDMLAMIMSQSHDIDDYTDLIKIENEHDESFLQFSINLFVAHHSYQADKIKIESSEKFIKLVIISNTKKSSQTDLNKNFITFKKSQNIVFHDDTDHE
jgi:hypothetical protein